MITIKCPFKEKIECGDNTWKRNVWQAFCKSKMVRYWKIFWVLLHAFFSLSFFFSFLKLYHEINFQNPDNLGIRFWKRQVGWRIKKLLAMQIISLSKTTVWLTIFRATDNVCILPNQRITIYMIKICLWFNGTKRSRPITEITIN